MISLGRSRKGKPTIGLGKLVERTMEKKCQDALWSSFFETVKIAVSEEEAIDAAKALSESKQRRLKRYGMGAVIGATSYPAVGLVGEAVKGYVAGSSGGRLRGAANAVRQAATAPELAKNITRGALGAGAVQALRENVQLQDAKKTYRSFLQEHGAA
jgi:hypothetical protein